MSISYRLRWSYVLSSTLPLLLIGALLISVLFRIQQRNAYASQQAIAEQIAGNISTFLYDLEQQLLRVARDLRLDTPDTTLSATVQRLVNSSPDLRTLTVVNNQAALIAQARSELLVGLDVPAAPTDQDLLDAAVRAGQGGRTSVLKASDGQLFFQVVLPVRDTRTGALVGALSAEVSLARISQILRLPVQGGGQTIYLLDADRQLILSNQRAGWEPPAQLDAIFNEQTPVDEYMGSAGVDVVGARAPVSPVTARSWSVIVERTSSDIFVDVNRSIMLLTAVVLLVGLLALTWALYQARRIVAPVRQLNRGAQALGAGQLDHRITVAQDDELGQLADSFNQMAAQLQASLRQIAQQNDRLRRGLELARDIQQGLLPHSPPWQAEVLSVHGRSLPANEVGGDFYTYLSFSEGRAAIAIGDISGKGVAAALLMALTSSTLESQAQTITRPAAMLYALNDALRLRLQSNQMNAAMLIAVYDHERQTMTIANAGMIAPMLVRRMPEGVISSSFLDVGGLPIGTGLDARYQEVELPLDPGDTLIFMSDGIVEAHNAANEMFGFERVEELVSALPVDMSVTEIVSAILDAVLAFTGQADLHDDSTIIATRLLTPSVAEQFVHQAIAHPHPAEVV